MAKSPYEVLGVNQTATADEIKRAYRKLVKQYHPDHYKNHPLEELAKEKMQEINDAYDQLTNPGRQSAWQNQKQSSHATEAEQARRQWQQQQWQQQQWQQQRQGPYYSQGGLCGSDLCNSLGCLCCTDSCCECMGGDLCGCC